MSEPNLCDCGRHLPCRHCQEPKASPAIYGQLIEIGNDLDGQPMLIIHTTKEAIKAFTGSALYREVAVIPVERAETPVEQRQIVPEGGDSAQGLEAARIEIQGLLCKWTDDAAWLERTGGRLDPYNAFTADAIRGCRTELNQLLNSIK